VRCWSEDPGLVWRSSLPIAWGKRLAKRAVLCWIDGTCHDVGVFPTLRHALFASEYLRRVHGGTGLEIVGAKVVPWGIDTSRFKDSTGRSGPPRRLLYAGQLVEHKGVHTAVEALQLLRKTHGCSELSLTLVGGAPYPEYEQRLRSTVDAWGLREHVSFLGALPREELPKIYGSHDILLFPSIWQEPFGIVLLEAMAAAMAVVATGTGGSAEIVRHELNALTFPAGDAVSCANRVLRLLREPGLCSKLGEAARRTVTERFPLKRTIDAIEEGALVALRTSVRQPSERLA
jgi:glycogen(starch) synthase